jgi:hypothetical protein
MPDRSLQAEQDLAVENTDEVTADSLRTEELSAGRSALFLVLFVLFAALAGVLVADALCDEPDPDEPFLGAIGQLKRHGQP